MLKKSIIMLSQTASYFTLHGQDACLLVWLWALRMCKKTKCPTSIKDCQELNCDTVGPELSPFFVVLLATVGT